MKSFQQSLSGGQIVEFAIPGRYFRYGAGEGSADISFFRGGTPLGEISGMLPGAWAKLNEPFDRVRIVNGPLASASTFVIGNGEVGVDSIAGIVSVRDNSVIRAIAGAAYFCTFNVIKVASRYSQAQLWNPPGSGKNVIVVQASSVFAEAGNHYHGIFDTVIGGLDVDFERSKKATPGFVKDATAQTWQFSSLSSDPVGLGSSFMAKSSIAAAVAVPLPFCPNIIVPPGFGYVFYTNTANTTNNSFIEWYEEPI